MKKQNHRKQLDDTIGKIEQIIEGIEPGAAVSISDIAVRANAGQMDSATKSMAIMLLKKYGIGYKL